MLRIAKDKDKVITEIEKLIRRPLTLGERYLVTLGLTIQTIQENENREEYNPQAVNGAA